MAFDVMKLFRKKKPEQDMLFGDLGDKEEPEAITGPGASQPDPPTGTSIEPKVIIGIVVGVCFLITFVVGYGLQGPTEKTSQEKAQEEFKKKQSSNFSGTLPDDLGKMSGGYGALKDPNGKDKNLNGNQNLNRQNPNNINPNAIRLTPQSPIYSQSSYRVPTTTPAPPRNLYALQPSIVTQQPSLEDKELEEARKSGLRFGGLVNVTAPSSLIGNPQPSLVANAPSAAPTDDTDRRLSFIQQNRSSNSFYVNSQLQAPASEFELQAGTVIPGVLVTGINSDLPGQIVAQVLENVYDSNTGNYLLIPGGSRLIGTYDSNMAYGQDRVLVVWNRLILPNGGSIDLQGMVGADVSGYSGFTGRKNDHVPRLLNGVILGSILTAGARVATGDNSNTLSYSQLAGQGIAENIAQAAGQITSKNLNIQPTIEIAAGYVFNVFVNKDLILQPYQD